MKNKMGVINVLEKSQDLLDGSIVGLEKNTLTPGILKERLEQSNRFLKACLDEVKKDSAVRMKQPIEERFQKSNNILTAVIGELQKKSFDTQLIYNELKYASLWMEEGTTLVNREYGYGDSK